ncbi:MAG: hypothetical protein GY855_07760 [candidate division Zixibacteria bacterium]|nr:hypothetical protein [candidate division Zixibacteria bacterium]
MLGLVNNKFIIGKEEFYCIAAEMHYYRVHKRYWAICFERIKKAGFTMISSSVPWNLHEEMIGQFDFSGRSDSRKDLIVFLELAREFGFKVVLRVGPFIGAEWDNGGIPEFIFADTEILARDPEGNPLTAKSEIGVNGGFVPSYLHPRYLNHVKRYFTGLVEAIQNYIYPKGPVFLIHIDDDPSFRGNDKVFDGDYSDFTINERYLQFLESKYGDIKNLNLSYNHRYKKFSEIEAPIKNEIKKQEDLLHYLDWVEFKENTLSDYVDIIRERLESLGVGALFSTGASLKPYFGSPANWQKYTNNKVSVGLTIDSYENYPKISRSLRYLNSTSNFSWVSKLYTGRPADQPGTARQYRSIDNRSIRFMLTTALASGMKGLLNYMFVERDHWYDSPLGVDGTVGDSYEMISRFNESLLKMKLENIKGFKHVGVAYDRTYLKYRQLETEEPFPYLNYLTDFCFPGICRGMGYLNYDYSIPDTSNPQSFEGLKLVFVPLAEFMPDHTQTQLLEMIKKGATVVFVGLVPKFNELFRSSQVLSKSLGISTKRDWGFGSVQLGSSSYDAQFFGSINKRNSAWRIFAKSGNKIVGAHRKLGQGICYVLTFDPGLTYDANKTDILQKLFGNHKITTPVYSSDPNVDIFAQADDAKSKTTVLFVINHNPRYEGDGADNLRRVVIRADSSIFKSSSSARVKLVNPLDEEVINTTVKEIGEGIFIEIENMDSRIYLVEKR